MLFSCRHKHGYVSRTQFQQCLSQLGIILTTDEAEALIGHFSDKEGVNYIAVLQYVDPSVPEQNKYQLRLAMLAQPNKVCYFINMVTVCIHVTFVMECCYYVIIMVQTTMQSHDIPSGDEVLMKIKIKVSEVGIM